MYHLHNAAATVTAMQGGADGTGINLSGIQLLLITVAGLVVIAAGITIAFTGRKGNFKKSADSGSGVMVGVFVIGVGMAMPVAVLFGQDIINWLAA